MLCGQKHQNYEFHRFKIYCTISSHIFIGQVHTSQAWIVSTEAISAERQTQIKLLYFSNRISSKELRGLNTAKNSWPQRSNVGVEHNKIAQKSIVPKSVFLMNNTAVKIFQQKEAKPRFFFQIYTTWNESLFTLRVLSCYTRSPPNALHLKLVIIAKILNSLRNARHILKKDAELLSCYTALAV